MIQRILKRVLSRATAASMWNPRRSIAFRLAALFDGTGVEGLGVVDCCVVLRCSERALLRAVGRGPRARFVVDEGVVIDRGEPLPLSRAQHRPSRREDRSPQDRGDGPPVVGPAW